MLKQLGITPIIRIRVSANARAGGADCARALAVLDQFGGEGGCANTQLNYMQRLNGGQTRKSGRKTSCIICGGLLRL